MAGGAALVGLAGGLVLSRNKKRRGVLGHLPTPTLKTPNVKMPKLSKPDVKMPKPGPTLKAIGDAAGEVAQRSQRLGEVASEVQKASTALGERSK